MKALLFFVLALLITRPALSQNDSTKFYTTASVSGEPPLIDGKLNDAAWELVPWAGGDFRQVNPDKGKPASVQTKFKILYDLKNLYVAFRCYDPDPSTIARRMSRRDGFEGDWVEINIDSYYDKRTAFSFTSSVSGVKSDEFVSNNGENWDAGWDPIWYLKTSVDDEGWIAELRIPLSQLRFTDKPELTWGLQIQRYYFRNQERSQWQYIPPDAAGYVHLIGEMNGIRGIRPQKQLEIQPYLVARAETFEKEAGNPYATGKASGMDAGLDAKIGITSDITLDLTVNPDFGQVEADPSQVNLSAFELFFQERRPFFTEGNNTLNFPVSQINNNILFYSRRIGRQPQGWPETDLTGDDQVPEYAEPNGGTTILGAAKLSGKNKKGFSWALLESVTAREYSQIDSLGFNRRQLIEPLTNYFVSRAQQEINKGNTTLGAIFTATNRKIEDARLRWLHDEAYSGGIDFLHHWKQRAYYVSAKAIVSQVKGSEEAITATQLSSERFFQRPDNHHTEFNPDRRSLTGTGGQLIIGKKSGDLISDLGVMWQSPELELNDIGFLSQTDNIMQWFWMQYRILKPAGITRWQRYNINEWREYDFGMKKLNEGYNVNAHWEFKNFWQSGGGVSYQSGSTSNADLRGGPALRYPSAMYYWIYAATDRRKKLSGMINHEFSLGRDKYIRNASVNLDLTYQPVNAFNISVSPSFGWNKNQMQYVTTASSGGEPRYVVAAIDQTTARVTMRMTYMVTPNFSIQYYGQPFGSAGVYSDYKYITDASAGSYYERFTQISPANISATANGFSVDDNRDGMPDYGFGNPDFNFGQFRSNMVLRWEYIPGSTFFLVWSKERNGAFYDHRGERAYRFDFAEKGHHIFLLKFTYRFAL
jgi:hypothetical protein